MNSVHDFPVVTQEQQALSDGALMTDAALGNALMRQLEAKWQAKPETVATVSAEFSEGYDDGRGGRPQAGQGAEYVNGYLAGRRTNRRVGVR